MRIRELIEGPVDMPKICPAGGDCPHSHVCQREGMCTRLHTRPLDRLGADYPPATHFIGFTDTNEYHNAVQVFGEPDFIHRTYDQRALADIAPGDRVIFTKYHDQEVPSPSAFDDSSHPDDPAEHERQQPRKGRRQRQVPSR